LLEIHIFPLQTEYFVNASWAPLGGSSLGGNTLVCGPTSFPIYTVGWGVYRLTALDANWEELPLNAISLAIDPSAPNILYGGTYAGGVYKSIDGGAHWTKMGSGQPPFNFTSQRQVTAVAVDPANSEVYVGLQNGSYNDMIPDTMPSGGLWKSSDGGATWTDLGLPLYRGVNAIALDPGAASIYCGLQNSGLAASNPMKKSELSFLLLLLGD
jgi:hypothetical protein